MNRTPRTRLLAACVPSFQAKLRRLAIAAETTVDQVWALWCEYSDECRDADQSAMLSEFIEWKTAKLGGDLLLLRAAIQETL